MYDWRKSNQKSVRFSLDNPVARFTQGINKSLTLTGLPRRFLLEGNVPWAQSVTMWPEQIDQNLPPCADSQPPSLWGELNLNLSSVILPDSIDSTPLLKKVSVQETRTRPVWSSVFWWLSRVGWQPQSPSELMNEPLGSKSATAPIGEVKKSSAVIGPEAAKRSGGCLTTTRNIRKNFQQ